MSDLLPDYIQFWNYFLEYIIQGQTAAARIACEQHQMNGYLENTCSMLLSVKIVLDKSLAIFRGDMRLAKNTSRGADCASKAGAGSEA